MLHERNIPGVCFDIGSDLVFDDSISEIISKITCDARVPFVLFVVSGTGEFR